MEKSLQKYSADKWLIINSTDGNSVDALNCLTYSTETMNLRGFILQWSGNDSRRLMHVSNLTVFT